MDLVKVEGEAGEQWEEEEGIESGEGKAGSHNWKRGRE